MPETVLEGTNAQLAPRKPSSSAPRSGNGAPRKPLSGASGSRPSNGVKKEGSAPRKISELPAMGRKEKAAMKLAREAKSDSMFSVQSLVDMAEGTTSSRSVSPRRPPPPRAMPLKKQATTAMAAKSGAKGISGMKKGLDVTGLRKLCPDRDTRDNRTVDEVQRDIRLRKGLVDPAVSRSGPASASSSRPPSAGLPRDRDRDISRGSDRDRDRKALPARRSPPRHAGPGKARRRSPSISDSDSDASTPPRKRRVLGGPDFNGDAPASRAAVSAMIQGMFSRDGAPRRYDDDYSDGSDMEAGLSDIDSEEKRAAKLARREDLEEERKEAERRAAKERAKKMRK